MRTRLSVRAGMVLSLALLTCTGVAAGERMHRVRGGESASTIAQQHYGDIENARLLLLFNGRSGTVIQLGETLRVPYSDIHRVRKGDTWSRLAQRYLGDSSLYPAVATLNGRSSEQPLPIGVEIIMPVVFTHRVRRGETLNRIAERFYGNDEMREVLRTFNGIDDPRQLSVGQEIAVPLITLQLRDELRVASTREFEPPAPSRPAIPREADTRTAGPVGESIEAAPPTVEPVTAPPTEPVARFHDELSAASAAYDEGNYDGAREMLESMVEPVSTRGAPSDKTELGRLLAFVYVAFDLPQKACAVYRTMGEESLEQPPLDSDLVSPKIRDSLDECSPRPDAS